MVAVRGKAMMLSVALMKNRKNSSGIPHSRTTAKAMPIAAEALAPSPAPPVPAHDKLPGRPAETNTETLHTKATDEKPGELTRKFQARIIEGGISDGRACNHDDNTDDDDDDDDGGDEFVAILRLQSREPEP